MNRLYKLFFLFFVSYFTYGTIRNVTGADFGAVLITVIAVVVWLILCIFILRESRKYNIEKKNRN
jgi:uncharacterized membrane protein